MAMVPDVFKLRSKAFLRMGAEQDVATSAGE
jgi:hypothetical protein